ncbi:mitogen-activated protein kinase kinase kinase 14 [Pristis pectinata]|uniref:mitogen-activated protein kinase kinase kinase 14 n=1 Tax=Pristis pectinata TaxID=685728 RepID=UPI00223E559F|nr:mitogen-activated protein kinase kinase kinase 14 [Pristis pectinata]XP_051894781.1 mitogen-activated protein kinase kinase kinase 14 [Pristis pectinata]XP_051894782.1 mitogen-activated protein kinase kinase kinase 14 [Pristis pectinata]
MAVKCSSRHTAESDIRDQQELPISQMESKWFASSENKRCMKMSLPVKVLTEGTAKQEMDNNGSKFSYIAQATGIGNQKLIPSCEKPQFIATPNSYSNRAERLNLENVPNNVAKVAEGKLPQLQQDQQLNKYPRRKRRRRKSKHKAKASQKQSKTPEQESCPPIPVQEDDAENSTSDFCSSTSSSSSSRCELEQMHISAAHRDSHGLCGLGLQNRLREDEKIENMYFNIKHFSDGVKKSNVRPIPSSVMKSGGLMHNMAENFERKLHLNLTPLPQLKQVDVDGGHKKQEISFNNNAAMLYINDVGGDTGIRIPDSISAEETSPPQFSAFQSSASKGYVISDNLRCLTMPALQWAKYSEGWKQSEKLPENNEGVLQHERLKPVDNQYKENLQWSICSNRLGVGTFGEVYVAKDHTTDFTCAAKRIHVSKFQPQELLNWSKLNSPRVVPLYGGVREGEMITLFMQHVQGGSVAQLIGNRGPLPEAVALYYTSHVLEALEHLHSLGIVHGDVKADNVLISHSGREVYLCDFGHSTQLTPTGNSTSNAGSHCLGTVTHMAPEVVAGSEFGVRVDSWSVACMMLHMLNGHHPWKNISTKQLLLKIVTQDPPVNEIPPACSPHTANVIRAGLMKNPEYRASASELHAAVNRALTSLRQRIKSTPQSNHVQKVSCAAKSDDGNNKGLVTSLPVNQNARSCTTKGRAPLQSETVPAARDPNRHRLCYPKRDPLNANAVGAVEPLIEKNSPQVYRRKPKNCIRLACNFDQLHLQDENIRFPEEVTKPVSDEKDPSLPSPLMSLSSFQNSEAEKKLAEEYGNLQKEFLLYNLSQVFPEKLEDHMLDALSSDAYSTMDDYDKDSQKGMPSLSGNYSSGIHSMSWNSHTDGLSTSFSLSQRLDHQQDMPSLFNGIEARIHTFSGECLIVHDVRRATVGQVATGISNLIQVPSFSLVKQNGHPISPDFEIPDSGIDLKCTPASNSSSSWTWRIKDGNLNFKS